MKLVCERREDMARSWLDRVFLALTFLCVFVAGASFVLGQISFVLMLIAAACAWGCID